MNVKRRKGLAICAASVMMILPAFGLNAEAKRIYTGNTKVDAAAEKIIRKCTTPKMSRKEKLRAVYVYLVKNMRYSHSKGSERVKVTSAHKKNWKKYKKTLHQAGKVRYSSKFASDYSNLLTLQGTCKDMSGVMCILANHLGYKAGYDRGRYVRSSGSTTEHWWNYVIVKGKRKYFDVQAANDSWKRHHSMSAVRGFCLRDGDSSGWRKHHRG